MLSALLCLILGVLIRRGWVVKKKILKVGVHNKVTFRASYNFIGKTGGRNKDGGGGGVFTV